MNFWTFLGYVTSFMTELLSIPLFTVSVVGYGNVTPTIGSVIVFSLLLVVIFHLLTPSAKGI